MLSKTLSFNKTIFWKTVTRFWPIWFLYAGIWLILMPGTSQITLGMAYYTDAGKELENIITNMAVYGGLIMGGIFAVFSAMAVWSFLYSTRATHAMASLPVRREGVFCSVVLAGIAPLLAANVLIFALTLGVQLLHGEVVLRALLEWFGSVNLMLLFFYGFATLCAQLTGNIGVLPAVYAVLNFTAVVVEAIVRSIGESFIYGFTMDSQFLFLFLSPPAKLLESCRSESVRVYDAATQSYHTVGYVLEGWPAIIVYALVGLVLLGLALLLYRRRRMETAGDVVAVRVLKPVFKYCLSFGCALVLGFVLYGLFLNYEREYLRDGSKLAFLIGWMLIGAFLGYFAAEMLNQKSFRVWKGKWRGFAVTALILLLAALGMEFDLLGVERYVPQSEKVDSVLLRVDGETIALDEKENIEAVLALHESIVSNKNHYESMLRQAARNQHYENYTTTGVSLFYSMGEKLVERYYILPFYVNQPDTYRDAVAVQRIANCSEAIWDRKTTAFELTAENVFGAQLSITMTGAECARQEGYSSTEEFLLCYYEGMNPGEVEALEKETRERLLLEILERQAQNLDEIFWKYAEYESLATASDLSAEYAIATKEGYRLDPAMLEELDLDKLFFRYEVPLSVEEAMELYNSCILPDIGDNSLGRIWIISDEEYETTVCSAQIGIDARVPLRGSDSSVPEYSYEYFYTVPTVDSHRTNRWLAERGYTLHTVAETSVPMD